MSSLDLKAGPNDVPITTTVSPNGYQHSCYIELITTFKLTDWETDGRGVIMALQFPHSKFLLQHLICRTHKINAKTNDEETSGLFYDEI